MVLRPGEYLLGQCSAFFNSHFILNGGNGVENGGIKKIFAEIGNKNIFTG